MLQKPLIRLLLSGVILGTASIAPAVGFYNVPTNLRQCLGVGFGPGYHAPLLLGNPYHAGNEAKPIKWMPRGLAPTANHGFAAAPTAWTGCDSGQCGGADPGWESYTHPNHGPNVYFPAASQTPMEQPSPAEQVWSATPAPRLAAPSMPAATSSNVEVIPTPQPTQ